MAVAAIFVAPTVGAGTLLSKRKQAKRQQAAANKWSGQFPLTDNKAQMQQTLTAAELQLKTLRAQRPKGIASGVKKWKADEAELAKWVLTIKGHIKGLKSGIDVSSTNVPGVPVQPAVVQTAVAVPPAMGLAPAPVPTTQAEEMTTETIDEQTGAAAKKPNYLLYAGIAVGVILLVRALNK